MTVGIAQLIAPSGPVDTSLAAMRRNRDYCTRHGLRYHARLGNGLGPAVGAAGPRLRLVEDAMRDGFHGWLVCLDADIYFATPDFDCEVFLRQHMMRVLLAPSAAPPSATSAGQAAGGEVGGHDGEAPGRPRSRVLMFNLAHPRARDLVTGWREACATASEELAALQVALRRPEFVGLAEALPGNLVGTAADAVFRPAAALAGASSGASSGASPSPAVTTTVAVTPAFVDDPGLIIDVGGRQAPGLAGNGVYRFLVPQGARNAWLLSRSLVPRRVNPAWGDGRRLGVAIRRIACDGQDIPLTDRALLEGWYPIESGRWRWTDGCARLRLPGAVQVIEIETEPACRADYPTAEPRPVGVDTAIDFGVDGNSAEYLWSGWSRVEPTHTWTIGNSSVVAIDETLGGDSYLLKFSATPCVDADHYPFQRCIVLVNDERVGEFRLERYASLECPVPGRLVNGRQRTLITFQIPDAVRPCDYPGGEGEDRWIGLAFNDLALIRLGGGMPDGPPGARKGDDRDGDDRKGLGAQIARLDAAPRSTIGAPAGNATAALLREFENLGPNCEFGVVQRHFQAESLGLFAFSSTPIDKLTRAVAAGFEDYGDPAYIEIRRKKDEWFIHDGKFGFVTHTWSFVDQIAPEVLKPLQCKRLRFLTRKLLADLRTARKIFVYGGHSETPYGEVEIRLLLRAMRQHGEATLLWVADCTDPARIGTVEPLDDGLMKGYASPFQWLENVVLESVIAFDEWLRICRAAQDLRGRMAQRLAG